MKFIALALFTVTGSLFVGHQGDEFFARGITLPAHRIHVIHLRRFDIVLCLTLRVVNFTWVSAIFKQKLHSSLCHCYTPL